MRKVYFDNVSTTSLNPEVRDTYQTLLNKYFCNSDALYDDGVAIYEMMETSRTNIAKMIGVEKDEIIFTSGASEANSLAIKGLCHAHQDKKHIVTSIYEHSSTYNAIRQLEENFGYEVTYLKPKSDGKIDPEDVRKSLKDNTILVSIMWVNNEIGSINDIDTIKTIVKKHSGTYFHTDITQGFTKMNIDMKDIDMASFSAHKIHGLKGSGVLLRKRHVELLPLISGGQQEFSIRGGTSNALVNIVLAKTIRISLENMKTYQSKMKELHDYFKKKIDEIDEIVINSPDGALDCLFNISTPVPSEVLLNALNIKGIMISSKSTCSSKEKGQNRTLSNIGADEDLAIRVSFDKDNTLDEIDYFIDAIKEAIGKYA